MARGRFIANKITTDRQVNELSSDTCRLAYTWMITLADKEGRVIGEPEMLLALLFPRRRDISAEQIEQFIIEWVNSGFIFVFENSDGDKVLQLINFEKHQVGLRKDKEPESVYDSPDKCRIIDGKFPEKVRVKLREVEEEEEVNNNKIEVEEEVEEEVNRKTDPAPATDPDLEGINQFTREEVSEERDLVKIYMNVTGNMGLPVKSGDRIALIDSLRQIHANKNSHTTEYLRPFFKAWLDRSYSRTNIGWLDWAMSGEVKDKKDRKDSPMQEKSASQRRLEKLMGG